MLEAGLKMAESRVTTSRRRELTIKAAKAAWVLIVLVSAVWYLAQRGDELIEYTGQLGWAAPIAAVAALGVGRLLLSEISRCVLAAYGAFTGPLSSLAINSVSQLGKYVPGSVWHLFGRVALYRRLGLSSKQGSGVLVIENAVLLVSGAGVALLPVAQLGSREFLNESLSLRLQVVMSLTGLALAALTLMGTRALLAHKFEPLRRLQPLKLVFLSLFFWLVFGFAFWLCIPSESRPISLLPIAAGVFAAAWVVGNLAPFAPAGIGVREVVIVALLSPYLGSTTAIGAAAVSRLMWTINELLMAVPASILVARAPGTDLEPVEGLSDDS